MVDSSRGMGADPSCPALGGAVLDPPYLPPRTVPPSHGLASLVSFEKYSWSQ
jgi:hypothetical protein